MIFMYAAKGAQKITCASPQSFSRVDVNLTNAITIIITCPFVVTMIDRDPFARNPTVACPFISIHHRLGSGELGHVSL